MSINFAALNMAGYNNPDVKMIPVTLDYGETFINPPSYADISNICKSGAYPVLCVTNTDHSFAYILPLSYYSYDGGAGTFSFCGTVHNGEIKDGVQPSAVSVIFAKGAAAPVFQYYTMPNPSP